MAIVHVLGSSSIIFYLLLVNFSTSSSISQSEALLKLKNSFVNTTALDSWKPGTEPCSRGREWACVVCVDGTAAGLRLGHLGLLGTINVDALVSLPKLRLVSFVSNGFSGPIPNFHRMGNLRGLFLSRNQFSGEIPSDYFAGLSRLKKVWLSGNGFSGSVPSSLSDLSDLTELHLEDNQFSGVIPRLTQPGLVSLNISNNKLEGEIPSTMLKFSLDSFNGNPGLCGESLGTVCRLSSSSPTPNGGKQSSSQLEFLWALMPAGIVFAGMIVGIVTLKRRNREQQMLAENSLNQRPSLVTNDEQHNPSTAVRRSGRKESTNVRSDIVMVRDGAGEFKMSDLMRATAEMLGNGSLGCSYKVTTANGTTVVVKRTREMNEMDREQFDAAMKRLGSLSHSNVLSPLAYFYRHDEKLLISEHRPGGSLRFALHGTKLTNGRIDWSARLKIVQGIARGLAYLHTEFSSLDLPHGNLKASNVILTSENEALLADYGFSSMVGSSEARERLEAYKTPEAILQRKVSPKCDVYCLGVVMLEILTGKAPSLGDGEVEVDIVRWARSTIAEGKQCDIFDPEIVSDARCMREMGEVLRIGVACTQSNPDQRLDIAEAVRRIESVPDDDDDGSSLDMETAQALSLYSDDLTVVGRGSNYSGKSSHDIGDQ
ncbi:pollen receptor-like kinase 3 [Andrographis paniculata]|uniref:pollen receptor-like kinase 3 n=1 Tax=Andrographis paniculata TaxID=175694 RepID=UPI0021E7D74B|nr:pollen receptor-like kinase 3 [Andrographis paniculata]